MFFSPKAISGGCDRIEAQDAHAPAAGKLFVSALVISAVLILIMAALCVNIVLAFVAFFVGVFTVTYLRLAYRAWILLECPDDKPKKRSKKSAVWLFVLILLGVVAVCVPVALLLRQGIVEGIPKLFNLITDVVAG